MPKPSYRPKKISTYKPSLYTGVKRATDSEQTSENRRELERRAETRSRDTRTANAKRDRQYRQTDTGTSKKNEAVRKARRMKNMTPEYISTHSQSREKLTDAHTSHSARTHYGNSDATKRAMQEKYGNTRQKPSLYDRANYKGQEMERKVKRKWKPSDTPSQRPDENGREWENHKYIDKVKTKSGKIRYIYEIEGGGSKQQDAGKTMRQNHNSKSASQKNHNLAPARKVAKSARAFLKGLFG